MKARLVTLALVMVTAALLGLIAYLGNPDEVAEIFPGAAIITSPNLRPENLLSETVPPVHTTDDSPDQIRRRVAIRAAQWYGRTPYEWGGLQEFDPGKGYRRDCSGLVSYAWGLPSPGPVTSEFVSKGYAARIPIKSLETGDALNNDGLGGDGHMVLFWEWAGENHSRFWALEMSGHFTDAGRNDNAVLNLYRIETCNAEQTACKIRRVYNWNQRRALDFTDGTYYYAENMIGLPQTLQ